MNNDFLDKNTSFLRDSRYVPDKYLGKNSVIFNFKHFFHTFVYRLTDNRAILCDHPNERQ